MRSPACGYLHTAMDIAVDEASRLQAEIIKTAQRDHLAENGPVVVNVRVGMIYVYRAWNDLISAVQSRQHPSRVSRLMLLLSGALIKIGTDLSAASRETFSPDFADHIIPNDADDAEESAE